MLCLCLTVIFGTSLEAQSKLLSAYISDSPSCYPPLEGLGNTLEVQSSWDPKAAQAKAEDFLDLRFADQLRSSGCSTDSKASSCNRLTFNVAPGGTIMTLTAYNQISVPSFMYGTAWKKEATAQCVLLAVGSGFKAIDTANQLIHYQEILVGEALQALDKKGVKRNSLFLQTKFTPVGGQDHRTPYDPSADLTTQVKQSFASSLAHLATEYVDSYVLHAPFSRRGLGEADWEVWSAMEALYQSGKTKMIGVSNITAGQLIDLCEQANHKPMMVQNRCYAALAWDKEIREICQAQGIIYQGFSLLTANRDVLADPQVQKIARRLGATSAQIIFRFAMQIGMLPLTGTTSPEHMREDLDAEQLALSKEEIDLIESIAV